MIKGISWSGDFHPARRRPGVERGPGLGGGGPATDDSLVVISAERAAREANAAGMRLLKRRRVKQATAAFERAYALNPADLHAAYNLACMRARARNVAAAIELLRTVAARHPEGLARQIAGDEDFAAIRGDPAFARFLRTLRP